MVTMRTPGTPHARAGVLYVNQEEQTVLLGYRENNGRIYYTVPGGEIEPGEDAVTAAAREFTEETNLVAEGLTLLATFANPQNPLLTEHVYTCSKAYGNFDPSGDPDRALPTPNGQVWDIRWVSFDTLPDLPLLPDAAKQALLAHLK